MRENTPPVMNPLDDGVRSYFTSPHSYTAAGGVVTNVRSGEYHVTDGGREMMVTVLGSCVAVCVHDPVTKISGMNHFLLPGDIFTQASPKYGIFAMEYMINEVLKRGGLKTRLQVKVFGGAKVLPNSSIDVGDKNIQFIKSYIQDEELQLVSSDLGADYARRIHFCGDTGKVMMRKVESIKDVDRVISEEKTFSKELDKLQTDDFVELFGKKS